VRDNVSVLDILVGTRDRHW